jgi:hypothetical protein
VESVLAPYIQKYGSKIRVLGDRCGAGAAVRSLLRASMSSLPERARTPRRRGRATSILMPNVPRRPLFPPRPLAARRDNHGIARGIVALTNNASNPYFLFLERDFQLIEPDTCVYEQLAAGVELLRRGQVHVVRYRHRRHAGRPNWAENFFKGHEDDAFGGRQPNLACNIFYWIWDVEKRWPEQFWKCGEVSASEGVVTVAAGARGGGGGNGDGVSKWGSRACLQSILSCSPTSLCATWPISLSQGPEFICSDSYYCNWTNNPQVRRVCSVLLNLDAARRGHRHCARHDRRALTPNLCSQMWSVAWWNEEYVSQFHTWTRNDPVSAPNRAMGGRPGSECGDHSSVSLRLAIRFLHLLPPSTRISLVV